LTLATLAVFVCVRAAAEPNDLPSLRLNGAASLVSTVDGDVLRVAPADFFQAGSAFTPKRMDVRSFQSTFQFRLSDSSGADGIVMVIQSSGASALGLFGPGIGYAGISKSVAIEFDTWFNEPGFVEEDFVFADPDG
jgi:hypothetical protein